MIEVPIWVVVIVVLSSIANVWATLRHIERAQALRRAFLKAWRSLDRAQSVLTQTRRGKVSEDVLVIVEDVISRGLDEIGQLEQTRPLDSDMRVLEEIRRAS